MTNPLKCVSLYDLKLVALEQSLLSRQLPAFRARQIYRHLYVNFRDSFEAMTDLPIALRKQLSESYDLGTLRLVREQSADEDLTTKALFELPSGEMVEAVLMVYPDRATVCVSSQAGCAMGCVFCATGQLGLLRNLTAGQIVEQVLWASRKLHSLAEGQGATAHAVASDATRRGREHTGMQRSLRGGHLTNIVFMGMGEPFANYDRWRDAVDRLHDAQGFNMGARSMTVSTVGLPHGIRRLAEDELPINLAISLHAPNDRLRTELVPVNERFPISEIMAATRFYVHKTKRRVSFEYVLLQQRNDEPKHAAELVALLRGQTIEGGDYALPLQLMHVNIIPWNPVPGMPLGRSAWARVLAFQQVLRDGGIACTVRVERGLSIAAACGQLAAA